MWDGISRWTPSTQQTQKGIPLILDRIYILDLLYIIDAAAIYGSNCESWKVWLVANELESLGVNAKHKEELNDLPEVSALTENLKQLFYEEYQMGSIKDNR